jgi:hypothetical protein
MPEGFAKTRMLQRIHGDRHHSVQSVLRKCRMGSHSVQGEQRSTRRPFVRLNSVSSPASSVQRWLPAARRRVIVLGVWYSMSRTGCLHAGHTRPVFCEPGRFITFRKCSDTAASSKRARIWMSWRRACEQVWRTVMPRVAIRCNSARDRTAAPRNDAESDTEETTVN